MSSPEEVPKIPSTAEELIARIDQVKTHKLGELAIGSSENDVEPSFSSESTEIHENPQQKEIFGEELEAIKGHESLEESTQSLVNAIKTLTQEKGPSQRELEWFSGARKLSRRLRSRGEDGSLNQEIGLSYYPEGTAEAAPNVSSSAEVELTNLHTGIKHVTGKVPGFESRRAFVSDDLYVDKITGKAMLRRRIEQINGSTYSASATREASEAEVQEAMDVISRLAQEEGQHQTAQTV